MYDDKAPDWADLLAKLWADEIRNMYRNKGFDGSPSKPLVERTAKELMKPVEDLFNQGIDYNAPDRIMREVLKKNIWDFSVAKNYQDNVRLNNLLLDENGKLRSWSDFKYQAQNVVGLSNRYLKTEYNTVVAGAQMSRLWQNIQRDKAIFPFAQFDVVDDGHTSDICKPLKDVIVSVDDPMLAYYFPPNHFNCRTTVRRLRKGTPTGRYEVPQIPKAFQNNVGATGEIFTPENAYLANTPKEVIDDGKKLFYEIEKKERYAEIEFIKEKLKKGLLEIFKNGSQTKAEAKNNLEAMTIFAETGQNLRLLPIIDDGLKNPDGLNLITGNFIEVKTPQSLKGKNIMQSALKEASKQGAAELIIYLKHNPDSFRSMYEALKLSVSKNRNKNIEKVIVIYPDKSVKTYEISRIRDVIKKAQN